MFLLPLLLTTLFQYSFSQTIIQLNSFKGGNVDNQIYMPPPYSLYVSAHMDASSVLSQIWVKTDNNQMKNLEDLKLSKVSSSSNLLKPMLIQSTAYISSSLSDTQMASLAGFLYITTAKQSNVENFQVYSVDQSAVVKTITISLNNGTLVFLNSNQNMVPWYSSTISGWQQDSTGVVKMYKGIPKDDLEQDSTQILSNPIQVAKGAPLFLPVFEKFSVSLPAFYLKTSGVLNFVINPYYFDNHDIYTTTSYRTTGFYMKDRSTSPKKVAILCARDTRFNGTTGWNVVGSFLNQIGKINLNVNDGANHYGIDVTPANQILSWNVNTIGQNITISSVNSENGEFFVQYYVYQDQEISSTYAPGGVPTSTIQTTTKDGNKVNFLFGIMITMLFSLYL